GSTWWGPCPRPARASSCAGRSRPWPSTATPATCPPSTIPMRWARSPVPSSAAPTPAAEPARPPGAGPGPAPLEWRGFPTQDLPMSEPASAGARFRAALADESPLQVMGAITAYAGLMAKRTGYRALYLSGGGVAANSLGMPDLGISTMEDVLIDARRIVEATGLPLLVDIDTGWGGAFNIARTIRSFERAGVAAVHMEDQVGQKRCGHRPNKEVVSRGEMVDRVKAA